MSRRIYKRIAWILGTGAFLVGAWFLVGPQPLGGPMSFVVTSGNSMQPLFHTGDLVIVRRADSYRVGDVVAYRSVELNSVVIHRIIAIEGSDYVFKGDNNNFTDNEPARPEDLIGRKLLLVPGGGKVIAALATPKVMAVFAGLLGLWFFWENWGEEDEDEDDLPQHSSNVPGAAA